MKNTKEIKVLLPNGDFEEVVIITNDDSSETSMLKSTYDAQQAEQSTPNLAP